MQVIQPSEPKRRIRGTRIRSIGIVAALAMCIPIAALASQWHRAAEEAQLFRVRSGEALPDSVKQYAASRAQPLFTTHCASCHGADMKGQASTGVPDLTDGEWIYGTGQPDEIEQTILYGIRSGHHRAHDLADMPAFGHPRPYRRYALPRFSAAQIGDLADYVLALGGHPADPAAARRGHALFYSGGQCYDCHTSDANGDNFSGAPSLIDNVSLYGSSRAAIISTIAEGRAGVCPAWAGRLSAGDIRALAIYLGSGVKSQTRAARHDAS